MTKFRQHRGGYTESMATAVDASTVADLERIVGEFPAGRQRKGASRSDRTAVVTTRATDGTRTL